MRVSFLDPNGHAICDVDDARSVAKLKQLRVGDRISLRVGGKAAREFEVIGRVEMNYLGGVSLVLNGKTVLSNNVHEHTLKLTVKPIRKRKAI